MDAGLMKPYRRQWFWLATLGISMACLQLISLMMGTSLSSAVASLSIFTIGMLLRLAGCPEKIVIQIYLLLGPGTALIAANTITQGASLLIAPAIIGYLIALAFFASLQQLKTIYMAYRRRMLLAP